MISSIHQKLQIKSGFSLIELLVTVAITGILAGIAVPTYKIYKERAYDTGVINLINSLRIAVEASPILNNPDTTITTTSFETGQWFVNAGSEPNPELILPGIATPNENINFWVYGDTANYHIEAFDCRGWEVNPNHYRGYQYSSRHIDNTASTKITRWGFFGFSEYCPS